MTTMIDTESEVVEEVNDTDEPEEGHYVCANSVPGGKWVEGLKVKAICGKETTLRRQHNPKLCEACTLILATQQRCPDCGGLLPLIWG